jgi:hypothetical protein
VRGAARLAMETFCRSRERNEAPSFSLFALIFFCRSFRANGARVLGIDEAEHGLYFKEDLPPRSETAATAPTPDPQDE